MDKYGIQGDVEQRIALIEALQRFHRDVGAIPKGTNNPFFRSKYADYPTIMTAVAPLLDAHGLILSFCPTPAGVLGELYHVGGGCIRACCPLEHGDKAVMIEKMIEQGGGGSDVGKIINSWNPAQQQGSAMTYARRYLISSILNLVAESDDDGNSMFTGGYSGRAVATEAAPKKAFALKPPPKAAPRNAQNGKWEDRPACPNVMCDADAVIKDNFYEGDGTRWFCFDKKGGCGEKFFGEEA